MLPDGRHANDVTVRRPAPIGSIDVAGKWRSVPPRPACQKN
jgi:hypothetical protein